MGRGLSHPFLNINIVTSDSMGTFQVESSGIPSKMKEIGWSSCRVSLEKQKTKPWLWGNICNLQYLPGIDLQPLAVRPCNFRKASRKGERNIVEVHSPIRGSTVAYTTLHAAFTHVMIPLRGRQ